MAEGSYEYECMRAELLGIEKPDYDEFMRKKQAQAKVDEEEQDIENLKETEQEEEQLKHISGGLEELNSIMQVTQRKINRFKASCGSLTNLLKIKLVPGSSSEALETKAVSRVDGDAVPSSAVSANGDYGAPQRKSDLSKALDNHVDRLDKLLESADNAQHSMSHQNKEMKRFLN